MCLIWFFIKGAVFVCLLSFRLHLGWTVHYCSGWAGLLGTGRVSLSVSVSSRPANTHARAIVISIWATGIHALLDLSCEPFLFTMSSCWNNGRWDYQYLGVCLAWLFSLSFECLYFIWYDTRVFFLDEVVKKPVYEMGRLIRYLGIYSTYVVGQLPT